MGRLAAALLVGVVLGLWLGRLTPPATPQAPSPVVREWDTKAADAAAAYADAPTWERGYRYAQALRWQAAVRGEAPAAEFDLLLRDLRDGAGTEQQREAVRLLELWRDAPGLPEERPAF
jgi:hypothetical protein